MERRQYAVHVCHGGKNDARMEDLVRGSDYVKFAWHPTFGEMRLTYR